MYSWNELFNTEVGSQLFILTQKEGKSMEEMDDRILVLSCADFNTGRRYLKGLTLIEVRKADN